MNVGDRDREITLQTATTTTDDDTGEEVTDWDDAEELTLYAEWVPANTRESYFAGQRLAAHIDGLFRIEYIEPRPNPATQRIVWEGVVYDLKPAIEIGRREGWEIPVTARGDST